ncbi:MAG: hypothetical protein ACPGIC_01015 [Opitutales bacterium]
MPDTVGLRLAARRVIVTFPGYQHPAFRNDFVDPLRLSSAHRHAIRLRSLSYGAHSPSSLLRAMPDAVGLRLAACRVIVAFLPNTPPFGTTSSIRYTLLPPTAMRSACAR